MSASGWMLVRRLVPLTRQCARLFVTRASQRCPPRRAHTAATFGGGDLPLLARRARRSYREEILTNPRVYPRERRIWSGDPGNSETLNTLTTLEIESSRATSASRDREDSSGLVTKSCAILPSELPKLRTAKAAESIIDAGDKVALLIEQLRQKTETAPRHAVGAAAAQRSEHIDDALMATKRHRVAFGDVSIHGPAGLRQSGRRQAEARRAGLARGAGGRRRRGDIWRGASPGRTRPKAAEVAAPRRDDGRVAPHAAEQAGAGPDDMDSSLTMSAPSGSDSPENRSTRPGRQRRATRRVYIFVSGLE